MASGDAMASGNDAASGCAMLAGGVMVSLRGVAKRYAEGGAARDVIRRADAEIMRGEFVALAGPSGSGKTTLLNLISGLDAPTGGDVLIADVSGGIGAGVMDAGKGVMGAGMDAAVGVGYGGKSGIGAGGMGVGAGGRGGGWVAMGRLSERERTLFRRRNIGFVFQFFNLIDTLTVEENLLLPLHLNGVKGDEARLRAAAMLGEVGLGGRGRGYPDRLSGGEKQRVAIARALVHDPALVLADEPTGNLDAATGAAALGLLERLARDGGKTMIVVTHDDAVMGMADRALAMEGGRLAERVGGGL